MTPSNIEIVDAARHICEEWQRQRARSVVEEPQIREKHGVKDFKYIGAEEGYEFTIGKRRYSSSWDEELYYEHGSDLPKNPSRPEDLAAIAFSREFAALIESYYDAVHCAAEALGWYWDDDDEYHGMYYCIDADYDIILPHWCDDFDEIEFREVE